MNYSLRPYQQRVLDSLYQWWTAHPGAEESPICVMPTGSGKSVVIAELARLLFDTWPDEHPRTVVLVPSLGRKVPDADVIVATIGSIYRDAHLLGVVRCVVIDECHLVNPNGADAGRYRKFLGDLAKLCAFRVVGFTATPFRGNGVWLTDGDEPLFTGIAASIPVQELLDSNHLAPLVRPIDAIATRIDTAGIKTTSGDYNIGELSDRVDEYLPAAAAEAAQLAVDRRKWIAFTSTVVNAEHLVQLLQAHGVATALVCGETPATERADLIDAFRAGRLRCLVTVLALATGFDVPDVDCILWLRPTQSPVLYVQGAGRGLRIADGKADCLWLDFSDTTERLGPVDAIKGRKRGKAGSTEAPCIVCDNCGARVRPASSIICPECGHQMREEEPEAPRAASNAAVMASQMAPKIVTYPVTSVTYGLHKKLGSPDSLRVEYMSGLRVVAREWVCLEHGGFAGEKARNWWKRRADTIVPLTTETALDRAESQLLTPSAIRVNETGKYPEIVGYAWEPIAEAA
jgi:DNA repair protein RadD